MQINLKDPNHYAHLYNEKSLKGKEINILDSTLREGEQCTGISFTVKQRLQIAWMLDYFGVNAIEISPIVSQSHEESFKQMIKAGLNAKLIAHLRALPSDIDTAVKLDAEWIAMYHSISDIHLRHKLKVTREQTQERIIKAIEYAKSHGLKMRFTIEDASRSDPDFLRTICKEIDKAGANRIGIPDTLGIMQPNGMKKLVETVNEVIRIPIDVHCHNDLGLGLANSLAGVEAGADQIHTTINGIGERVGIASLAEASVSLKILYGVNSQLRFNMLCELSELLEEYTSVVTPPSRPLVGKDAYRHKAGTHVAAIISNTAAYEITPPQTVGNERKIIFGELSGKNGARYLLNLFGIKYEKGSDIILSNSLKNLKCGDLFELDLTKENEKIVLKTENKTNNENKKRGKGGERNEMY